jgi:lantibiotic modifying enzyme
VVALLAVARRLGLSRLVEAAVAIGDRLADRAGGAPYPGAWWGSDSGGGEPPLCGLAHGASGPAWALAELSIESGESRHRAMAHAATDYERAWYQPEQGNWPDLREVDRGRLQRGEPPAFPLYWCHGAPGIGLVRLRLFELDGHTIDAVEAEAALKSSEIGLAQMASDPSTLNLSLCHGLASLVELFFEGARVFEQPALRELANDAVELAAEVAGDGDGPWPCGVPDGGENPSLMLGLAGIGLMFLRAADPAVEGAGLLYARPVEKKRLIVKLQGPLEQEDIRRRAAEISEQLPGSQVERFSRHGRVLLRLPTQASLTEAAAQVQQLDGVDYAEPDTVDHATDS